MKTIVETPGEPYMVEDRTTPVFESTQHKSRMWLSLHEAMSVTGEAIADIVASAYGKTPTKSGLQFGWPSRSVLTKYLPDYAVVRRTNASQPVPITATFAKGKGRNRISEDLYYRSISQFCVCNAFSWSRANKILARQPGWKALLSPCMVNVTQHSPGWVPPGGWPSVPGIPAPTPVFEITPSRTGSRKYLTAKYIGLTRAAKFSNFPAVVVAHSK